MKYDEMLKTFTDNGIDKATLDYEYGLKIHGDASEGYEWNTSNNYFVHIIKGDRDNGRVDKKYSSEDEMVKAMVATILHKAITKRVKTGNNPKHDNSQKNEKIKQIAIFLDTKINGYNGFVIQKISDRETWEAYWQAVEPRIGVNQNDFKRFTSSGWHEDHKDAKENEEEELKIIKEKIDKYVAKRRESPL